MTRTTLQETLEKTGILVIDGSMSTALEQLGCDLNDSLWTARALDRQPELVRAGPRELLPRRRRLRHHLQLPGHHPRPDGQGPHPGGGGGPHHPVRGAVPGGPGALVAAGGPGGRPGLAPVPGRAWGPTARIWRTALSTGATTAWAMTSSGTSTAGGWSFLWQAGADVLLMETQPSLREARIELSIAEELGAESWVSFSCRDGSRIHEGDLTSRTAPRSWSRRIPICG